VKLDSLNSSQHSQHLPTHTHPSQRHPKGKNSVPNQPTIQPCPRCSPSSNAAAQRPAQPEQQKTNLCATIVMTRRKSSISGGRVAIRAMNTHSITAVNTHTALQRYPSIRRYLGYQHIHCDSSISTVVGGVSRASSQWLWSADIVLLHPAAGVIAALCSATISRARTAHCYQRASLAPSHPT
jgi:hypothetical protein